MDLINSVVAFIPLRGGSKSIPLKNVKLMAGKPLAYWAIKAAVDCKAIDKVVISTDSKEILTALEFIDSPKLLFYERSAENASDTASTEGAMWEFFKNNVCKEIILIQATSPLISFQDLDAALCSYHEGKVDSLLSLVRIKRFFWDTKASGEANPVNYDFKRRPRRQEFAGQLVENGAFYITRYSDFAQSKCRLNGKIGFYEMDEDSFVEIDEPSDWEIVENLLLKKRINNFEKLLNMKVFATDVDGCLTDGGMYYTEFGDEIKKFNTRDGFGLKKLQEAGIKVGIITAEDRELNRRRVKKLNLDFEFHASKNKTEALLEICRKFQVSPEDVAYVGDDFNEKEMMTAVGFSICPVDAADSIKRLAHFCSSKKGGDGVIREISDLYFFLKKTRK